MPAGLRRLSALGRLLVAVALLTALWVGTVRAVESATRVADNRRLDDWGRLATAFARGPSSWLESGRDSARELAAALQGARGAADSQPVIDSHLSSGRAFARDVLLVDRRLVVVGASAGLRQYVGRALPPCTRVGEDGRAVDPTLTDLVRRAHPDAEPQLSPIHDGQGRRGCARLVAVAAPTGPNVVVVVGFPEDGAARLEAVSGLDSARSTLVDPAGTAISPGQGDRPLAGPAATFLDDVVHQGATSPRLGADAVQAHAPVGGGWSLVLEQDRAAFDIAAGERPATRVAGILVLVFAGVFLLVTAFDVRRRRAHERAEVAKHAFFSTVGHELRTPLTVLKGYTETLAARWDAIDDGSRRMLVENMAPQAQRLAAVVEKLLTASNIQAEAYIRPGRGRVAVRPVCEAVVEQFRPLAPLHRFVVDEEPTVPLATADDKALEQVLYHLVDNAVKYSPSGGTVRLAVAARRHRVEVAVEDEGVGLPPNARHIFDALVQGEQVDRRVHDEGGAGVGLYIARTLVEDMGGAIRAERRAPVGARFVVRLRAAGADKAPAPAQMAR